MKRNLKGLIAGAIIGSMLTSGAGLAANGTTLYNVVTSGIKIIVDGKKINPTDANGNSVEPMIYNGTTYLPVRAVANALGKSVYWDGPNYTVYLGKMSGDLGYPTDELSVDDNIGDYFWKTSKNLKDNYGNTYSRAIYCNFGNIGYSATYEKLCNMKYSRFKGTIYVENGVSQDINPQILIKADGKTIYTSPEITKTSAPIPIDIDITGCNDFQIVLTQRLTYIHIGNAGFYQ